MTAWVAGKSWIVPAAAHCTTDLACVAGDAAAVGRIARAASDRLCLNDPGRRTIGARFQLIGCVCRRRDEKYGERNNENFHFGSALLRIVQHQTTRPARDRKRRYREGKRHKSEKEYLPGGHDSLPMQAQER